MEPPIRLLLTVLQYPSHSLREPEIQLLWKYLVPEISDVTTECGKDVRVIDTGDIGQSNGPDVRSVKVSVDGVTRSGDLEIHRQSSGWYHHGHHRDDSFNRVVIHVSLISDDTPIRRNDGTFVPNIVLEDRLPELKSLLKNDLDYNGRRRRNVLRRPCYTVSDETRYRDQLRDAGKAWLSWKASRIRRRNERSRLLGEFIEALGYSRNHDGFRRIADRLNPDTFYEYTSASSNTNQLEGCALGLGGWLAGNYRPKGNLNRVIYSRVNAWKASNLRKLVDAGRNWIRGTVRPHVFPIRRWIGLNWGTARLDGSWDEWIEDEILPVLTQKGGRQQFHEFMSEKFSLPNNNYWNHHYTLTDDRHEQVPDPFGKTWFDQLAVNVLFPYSLFRALESSDHQLKNNVIESFEEYPPVMENRRTKRMESQWGLKQGFDWTSASEQQGAVFLYKKGCKKGKCSRCSLSDSANEPQESLFVTRR